MATQKEMISLIVQMVKDNPQQTVVSQFVLEPEYPGEDLEAAANQLVKDASNPDNWNLYGEPELATRYSRFAGMIEYCFDCEPMDDQLRAYVYVKDGVIKHAEITGE
jgi:hypothetical protein